MALDKTLLNRVSNGPFSLWTYGPQTADNLAAMVTADYFLDSDIQPNLQVGDVIWLLDNTGASETFDACVVTASSSTTVTVATCNT